MKKEPENHEILLKTKNSSSKVLSVYELSKEYRLYDTPRARLKVLLTGHGNYRSQWALKNVSFTLSKGQCMGVVGGNGAGKSTLLKLITGTIKPTSGNVNVDGRITAILELGAGFHPDFTGRQNLHFSGSFIGLSAEKLQELESEILAFCELGDAIDRPVKTYSSGMSVRLAFALVTAVQPDVLIVDEALAVGDSRFQKKCIDRIQSFRNAGCSILFCSHSHYHVRQLCDTALWLEKGEQRMFGKTEDVLTAYEEHLRQMDLSSDDKKINSNEQDLSGVLNKKKDFHNYEKIEFSKPEIINFIINDLDCEYNPPLLNSKNLSMSAVVRMPDNEVPSIGFMIEQLHGVGITSVATHWENVTPYSLDDDLWRVDLIFPEVGLNTGNYVLSVYLFDVSGLIVYDEWFQYKEIQIKYEDSRPGILKIPHFWNN